MADSTGVQLSEKEKRLLAPDDTVEYAARVTRVTAGQTRIDGALVILTDTRFIAARSKLFGPPKLEVMLFWSEWQRIEGEPWDVDPLKIILTGHTSAGPIKIIDGPMVALDIENTARSLYRR